jgi:sialate O-acetylesterase
VADPPAPKAEPALFGAPFTDHAVLQRSRPIRVWGRANPGASVVVTLGATQASATASPTGRWELTLASLPAGGPYDLIARSSTGESETLSDVMVGDVFLCGGQSNMEFSTRHATGSEAALSAAGDSLIRLFQVPRAAVDAPANDLPIPHAWVVANSQTVADFSAVCYFFGHDLEVREHVPLGLISSVWGGTAIEAWMSEAALRAVGGYEESLALVAQARTDPQGARVLFAEKSRAWWKAHDPGARAGWEVADFDARSWGRIEPQGFWEKAGIVELADFDGVVWYRSEFALTAAQAAQGGRLALGPADDADVSYVNGQWIGSEAGWNKPRVYAVPAGALRAGRNVLAVGVLDTGGGGGLWGARADKKLMFADGTVVPLDGEWRYRISAPLTELASLPVPSPWDGPSTPDSLYNGMIAPIAPYGIAGVAWYQGEANASDPAAYARLMPAWIRDWRVAFSSSDLPFFVVQLTAYGPPVAGVPQRRSWGAIRDVQRRVVAADPRSALAVTIDVGDRSDIHPSEKRVVGERLARSARRMLYGENIETSGPQPVSVRRLSGAIEIRFAHTPLVCYSASHPTGFELCDAARACRFVDARVEGESVLLADAKSSDVAVRFCWGDSPICNLYNRDELPAVPFELEIR